MPPTLQRDLERAIRAMQPQDVLPASRILRVSDAAIVLTQRFEDLVIDEDPPTKGRAVCIRSGQRFAFRRVLEVSDGRLWLRGDATPFEEPWEGDIVGCVVPRRVDRIAALAPVAWTSAGWHGAAVAARAMFLQRKLRRPRRTAFRTEVLREADWPAVRAFWASACGRELPVDAQPQQHVIGLFTRDALVGVNIYLDLGTSAFAAFTLVDRRHRGVGGGQLMLARAIEETRRLGFESMHVHVNVRNLPSLTAYRRAGFVSRGWWRDDSDPLAAAERQSLVLERDLSK